jgi:hypothetical protein
MWKLQQNCLEKPDGTWGTRNKIPTRKFGVWGTRQQLVVEREKSTNLKIRHYNRKPKAKWDLTPGPLWCSMLRHYKEERGEPEDSPAECARRGLA